MEQAAVKLTVLFAEPFWIGLYEQECGGRYEAAKVVFGAEPRDAEVQAWLLQDAYKLRFSPSLETEVQETRRINPKRMKRAAERQTEARGLGAKAQQALKLQQEQGKVERKIRNREEREQEQERLFLLRQQKRKEKHRGH